MNKYLILNRPLRESDKKEDIHLVDVKYIPEDVIDLVDFDCLLDYYYFDDSGNVLTKLKVYTTTVQRYSKDIYREKVNKDNTIGIYDFY